MGRAAGPSHFFSKGEILMKTPTAQKTEKTAKPVNRNSFAFRARRDWQRNGADLFYPVPV